MAERRPAFTMLEVLVVLTIVGLLAALLLPAINYVRALSLRTSCSNHLRQVATALAGQATANPQKLPSGWGDPVHETTWLASLLPYVDERPLASSYNFDLAFDAAENATAASQKVATFLCPAGDSSPIDSFAASHYALNLGAQIDLTRTINARREILVGEIVPNRLGWARPRLRTDQQRWGRLPYSVARPGLCPEPCARQGLNKEPACPSRCEEFLQFSSPHAGGVSFAFVDTHAEFLSNSIDVDVLRRQLYPSDDDE